MIKKSMVFSNRSSIIKELEGLPVSKPLVIEPDDCEFIVNSSNLNIIVGEDNFVKTFFVANIVKSTLREGGLVIYVDLDTVFTAFFDLMVHGATNLERLFILTPNSDTIEKVMIYVCSILSPHVKLIVLDSITTFFHLLKDGGPADINRKISVYLNLLRGLARRANRYIIITSMMRAKKTAGTEPESWFPSPTGGRALLGAKTILKSSKTKDDIEINVIKHNERAFIDRSFRLPVKWGTL